MATDVRSCAAECCGFLVHLCLLACSPLAVSLCSLLPSVLSHCLVDTVSDLARTNRDFLMDHLLCHGSCIVACHVEEDLMVMEYLQKCLIAQVVA